MTMLHVMVAILQCKQNVNVTGSRAFGWVNIRITSFVYTYVIATGKKTLLHARLLEPLFKSNIISNL